MQPKLIIKKRLVQATVHQVKPSVNAIARLPSNMSGIMLDQFGHETLFKKTIMIGGRPARAGDDTNNAFETRVLDAFFKRDESLEITVSSLMIGQTYIGDSIWDALGFEVVVKRAFNSMLTLLEAVQQFDNEIVYLGQSETPRPAPVEQKINAIAHRRSRRASSAATGRIAKAPMDETAT